MSKINYCNIENRTQPRKKKQVGSRELHREFPMLNPHQEVPHRIPSASSNVCNLSAKRNLLEMQTQCFDSELVTWAPSM